MPRGKRRSCSEKLGELRREIETAEKHLRELKGKEKELLKTKREEDFRNLEEVLERQNLSVGEAAGILERYSEQAETAGPGRR